MSNKAALSGRWGATNHDFDFRKYNTFAEQIRKEQEAQFRFSRQQAGLQKRDGANAYDHKFTTGNWDSSHGEAKDIDWGKARAKERPLPIAGVPRPRFHNRGGDGTRRHWGSDREPQTSSEVGSWYAKPTVYTDIDYDGLRDDVEAAGGDAMAAVRAAAARPVLSADVSQDAKDEALLRHINGRRNKFGEEMYTVVNLENTGFLL